MPLQISNFHSSTGSVVPKKIHRQFSISPELYGRTTWDIDQLGKMNISSSGIWTITPLYTFTASIKAWGAGGWGETASTPQGYPSGGAGGYSSGKIQFDKGTPYVLIVGAGGYGSSAGFGTGGGMRGGGGLSGVFLGSYTFDNSIIVAGAGGSSAILSGYYSFAGGSGGGTVGAWGNGYTKFYGAGATQNYGGAPAAARDVDDYAGSIGKPYPSSGSALRGGSSSAIHYGGGSGYYGGGMGIRSNSGGNGRGSGGGGSGYWSSVKVISDGQTLGGSPGHAANEMDGDRGTAGNSGLGTINQGTGSHGKIVIF